MDCGTRRHRRGAATPSYFEQLRARFLESWEPIPWDQVPEAGRIPREPPAADPFVRRLEVAYEAIVNHCQDQGIDPETRHRVAFRAVKILGSRWLQENRLPQVQGSPRQRGKK